MKNKVYHVYILYDRNSFKLIMLSDWNMDRLTIIVPIASDKER